MRRLTQQELSVLSSDLREWRRPPAFSNLLQRANAIAGFYAVSQRGMQVWREAFVATSCALLTHADAVRLGEDPPDFQLRFSDHERTFEIVDVRPEGNHPCAQFDAYADARNKQLRVPVELCDMDAEFAALPIDLADKIAKKSAKGYPRHTILVADIHHSVFPRDDGRVADRLTPVAHNGLAAFAEVWLRLGDYLIRVTRNGATTIAPVRTFS